MDEKKVREAIEAFQGQVDWLKRIDDKECEESRRCCIEYFEKAIEALEKHLPKKVEIWNWQATCPNCKKLYGNMVDIKQLHPASWDFEYCKHCGQRLDW